MLNVVVIKMSVIKLCQVCCYSCIKRALIDSLHISNLMAGVSHQHYVSYKLLQRCSKYLAPLISICQYQFIVYYNQKMIDG